MKEKTTKKEIKTKGYYSICCSKCNKKFSKDENFIGVDYSNFIDNPIPHSFEPPQIHIYELTEYINDPTNKSYEIKKSLCYDCFNKYLKEGIIRYTGLDFIYVPSNFFTK